MDDKCIVCPCRVVVSAALDIEVGVDAIGGAVVGGTIAYIMVVDGSFVLAYVWHVTKLEIAESGDTLGCTTCEVCGEYGPGHDLSPALDD